MSKRTKDLLAMAVLVPLGFMLGELILRLISGGPFNWTGVYDAAWGAWAVIILLGLSRDLVSA